MIPIVKIIIIINVKIIIINVKIISIINAKIIILMTTTIPTIRANTFLIYPKIKENQKYFFLLFIMITNFNSFIKMDN